MTTHRIALGLLIALSSGCAASLGVDDHDETEDEPELDSLSLGLSSISCTERGDTGYRSGAAFPIRVVTVDGKPVERDTANAYYVMAQAASRDGVTLRISSGFRTMAEQRYFYSCYTNCNCNSCNLAARPGYSNHQSGSALDLNTSSSGVLSWLNAHGNRYGFRRTVPSEPWHWEHVGGGPGGGPCGAAPVPVGPPPPLVPHPNPVASCGELRSGEVLDPGEAIVSCGGRFTFAHQADGNVVLYDGGRALWQTGTHGRMTSMVVMQGDGNLVLYDRWAHAIWSSGSHGHPGAFLAMQADGNGVVYAGSRALWSTGTVVATPPPPASPPPPPPPPPPAEGCGALGSNASLAPGQSVRSCNGRFTFVHQGDGNVVLYEGGRALWSTGTHGRATSSLVMQGDGNLVLYARGGGALWHSGTHGYAGASLAVQDDANVVVYGAGRALWASHTAR